MVTSPQPLPVPDSYVHVKGIHPVGQHRGPHLLTSRFLRDLLTGAFTAQTWENAVRRHTSIDLTR